jgi:hypothetical protein
MVKYIVINHPLFASVDPLQSSNSPSSNTKEKDQSFFHHHTPYSLYRYLSRAYLVAPLSTGGIQA